MSLAMDYQRGRLNRCRFSGDVESIGRRSDRVYGVAQNPVVYCIDRSKNYVKQKNHA